MTATLQADPIRIVFVLTDPDLIERLEEMAEELGRTPSEQCRVITEDALTPKPMGDK